MRGGMFNVSRSVFFYVAAALAVISILLAVYFMIPGIYHPYFSLSHVALVDPHKHPATVKSAHHIYAAGFFVLAAVFALVAYFQRPKKTVNKAL